MPARDPHLTPPAPRTASAAALRIDVPVASPGAPCVSVPAARIESAVRRSADGARSLRLHELAAALGRPRNHAARELAALSAEDLGRMIGSPRTLLVEGATDQVVLQHLLRRLGDDLTLVQPAGSKTRLAVLHHLHRALRIPHHVLFDGDGGPVEGSSTRRHRVLRSRREATETLLAALREPDQTPEDAAVAGWGFGGPTAVGSSWSVLAVDLEDELSDWPSFLAALRSRGGALRAKRPERFAEAAEAAELADLPSSFRRICAAVTALVPEQPPAPGLGA